jgi:glyoxylase-like metal-dependent hydrolase (beta-lactamase superfamily II)
MPRPRLVLAAVLACPLALAALPPAAGAQSRSTTTRVVAQAVDALGGRSSLARLDTFRLQASGRTFIFDEGPNPGDTVTPASTFTATLNMELRAGGDRLRVDSVRTSLGTARRISEVIAGRRGFLQGVDANGGKPATTAMTSDRWAAVSREQRLLNPQVLLQDVLARPSLATTFPTRTLGGRPHRVLVIRDAVDPIRLYVDARTGRIDRLTTGDHQYFRRDVRLVVDFGGWRLARAGGVRVRFPRTASIKVAGQTVHTETRTSVAINRPADAARYRIPSGVRPTYSATLADRGARTTEWLMTFAHLGFPKDGAADRITPVPVAPGSTLITGIPNNSMIVEQAGGIVVVEGALNDFRAEALIRYIRATYPGKPIRFVTASHHHADHAGGMRPFVALGATAVVNERAVPLFRRVFANRASQLLPDRLDRSRVTANILAVPNTAGAAVTLADPVRPVVVLPEATEHAATTDLVFVPREGVLFVNGDTYTPGAPPGPGAQSLERTIQANRLNVRFIVGGHGTVVPYAAFRQAIGQPLPPA